LTSSPSCFGERRPVDFWIGDGHLDAAKKVPGVRVRRVWGGARTTGALEQDTEQYVRASGAVKQENTLGEDPGHPLICPE
jgi:hypothetical protein